MAKQEKSSSKDPAAAGRGERTSPRPTAGGASPKATRPTRQGRNGGDGGRAAPAAGTKPAAVKKGAAGAKEAGPAARGGSRRTVRVVVADPAQPNGPELTVSIAASRGNRAKVSAQDAAEAVYQVRALHDNDQIARGGASALLPAGATHAVEQGADGSPTLVRKRFSAL